MNDRYLDGRHVIGKHAIMGTDGLRSFGMVGQATIHEMTELLKEAARPTRIVLFGSHARGDADPGSDLDVLVVEKDVADRGA